MEEKFKILVDALDTSELVSIVNEFCSDEQVRNFLTSTLSEEEKEEMLLNFTKP